MRLHHAQFTVRRLMVALAVVAVAMGTIEGVRRRRDSFQRRAIEYRQKVSAILMTEQIKRSNTLWSYDGRTNAAYFQLAEHYDAQRVKYELAAARPWYFVSPDVPEPEWPEDVPRR